MMLFDLNTLISYNPHIGHEPLEFSVSCIRVVAVKSLGLVCAESFVLGLDWGLEKSDDCFLLSWLFLNLYAELDTLVSPSLQCQIESKHDLWPPEQ